MHTHSLGSYLAAALAMLACSAAGLAQSSTAFSAPKGLLTTEGNKYGYMFGAFTDGHFLYQEGDFRGTKMSLKAIAYRVDYRNHAAGTSRGRSWQNVRLDLCESAMNTPGNKFNAFRLTTPTTVFSSAVSWPTLSGFPSTKPATFSSGPNFPFKAPWTYSGKADLCHEYRFKGGTLAGNWAWTNLNFYHIDSSFYPTAESVRGGTRVGTMKCINRNNGAGAYLDVRATAYSNTFLTAAYRNTAYLKIDSYLTGPSMPVIYAIGFKGSTTGTVLPGVTCNRLHVDFSLPVILQSARAGSTARANLKFTYIPYQSVFAGLPIWIQAAWDYKGVGPLMLSQAVTFKFPKKPPDSPLRTVVYNSDPKADWGVGPYRNYYMHGVVRFSR